MCLKLLKTFYIICNWVPFLQKANYASHSKIIKCVYWEEIVRHYDSHLMNTGKVCAKTVAVVIYGFLMASPIFYVFLSLPYQIFLGTSFSLIPSYNFLCFYFPLLFFPPPSSVSDWHPLCLITLLILSDTDCALYTL